MTPNPESAYASKAELEAVEKQVASVASSVDKLADALSTDREAQAERDRDLRNALERRDDKWRRELQMERDSRRIPVGPLVAGGVGIFAVILTVSGMAAALIVFAITGAVEPIERQLKANQSEIIESEQALSPLTKQAGETRANINEFRDRLTAIENEFESHRDRVGHAPLVERVDGNFGQMKVELERVDALIEDLAARVSRAESDRFTRADGERHQAEIKELRERVLWAERSP